MIAADGDDMRAVHLLLAMGVVVAPAAAGASFDCARATGPIERAICTDPALAASDQKLATAYAAALAKVPESDLVTFKDGQRQWLRYVRLLCNPASFPAERAPQIGSCLADRYMDRVKQLESAVITSGGLTFRSVDSFTARKSHADDQPEWASPFETLEISFPQIENPKTRSEELLNRKFQALAEEEARNFAEGGSDITLSFGTINVSDKLISVSTTHTFYGHGAAHGLYTVSVVNWMRQEARALSANDMFRNETSWKAFLREYCFASVKREGFIEKPDDLSDMPEDPNRWEFSSEGLTINFNVYEVASYADGMQQVTIPWSALKPYLAETAPIALLPGRP